MKSKSIFSLKLFGQTLRQHRSMTIIFSVLMAAAALVKPLTNTFSIIDMINNDIAGKVSYPQTINFVLSSYYLCLIFIVIAPVIALHCWNYMTKRNACDFYHSLPYKRKCLYISQAAAIATIITIVSLISLIFTIAAYGACSKYLIVDYGAIVKMHFGVWSGALIVAGAISVACSITGTLFTNVIASGLIIFLPRFLCNIVVNSIIDKLPIMSSEYFMPIIDSRYNCVTSSTLFFMNNNERWYTGLITPSSIIYTLIVAVIYFVIAGILFKRRKSETAGQTASNKVAAQIIRVGIGTSICTVCAAYVFSETILSDYIKSDIIFKIIACCVFAFAAIAFYECLSSKSINRIKNAVPSVLISYAIGLLIFMGMNGAISSIINFAPEADAIDYVTVSITQGNTYVGKDAVKGYFTDKTKEIHITESSVKEIISESLKDNTDNLRKGFIDFYQYTYTSKRYGHEITINTNSGNYKRTVYMTQNQWKQLVDTISKNIDMENIFRVIPEFSLVEVDVNGVYGRQFDNEAIEKIYNTMREELRTVDSQSLMKNVSCDAYERSVDFQFTKDGINYGENIPISDNLPKTLSLYINTVNDYSKAKGLNQIIDKLNKIKGQSMSTDDGDTLMIRTFEDGYINGENYSVNDYLATKNSLTIDEIIDKLNKNETVDVSKDAIMIFYSGYDNSKMESIDATIYINI